MKSVITEIGKQALVGNDPMLILFGEGATEALKEYSVIQKFTTEGSLNLEKGQQLIINDQEYTITFVGSFANSNLNSIAHVTLVFDEVPTEDAIVNGIYLSPTVLPKLEVGSTIEYLSSGE